MDTNRIIGPLERKVRRGERITIEDLIEFQSETPYDVDIAIRHLALEIEKMGKLLLVAEQEGRDRGRIEGAEDAGPK